MLHGQRHGDLNQEGRALYTRAIGLALTPILLPSRQQIMIIRFASRSYEKRGNCSHSFKGSSSVDPQLNCCDYFTVDYFFFFPDLPDLLLTVLAPAGGSTAFFCLSLCFGINLATSSSNFFPAQYCNAPSAILRLEHLLVIASTLDCGGLRRVRIVKPRSYKLTFPYVDSVAWYMSMDSLVLTSTPPPFGRLLLFGLRMLQLRDLKGPD